MPNEPLNTPLRKVLEDIKALLLKEMQKEGGMDFIGEIPPRHLLDMIEQAENFTSYGKLNRFLGFIQGVLCSEGYLTVDAARDAVRKTGVHTGNTEDKAVVLGLIHDLVSDFFYYDRKECEYLSVQGLETVLKEGRVSREEIAEEFLLICSR